MALELLATRGMEVAVSPVCPRCARSSDVEELGTASGSVWLHCNLCGHLWRRLDPELNAFSLILASHVTGVKAIQEKRLPSGIPRASRFGVQLQVRYRTAGDLDWRVGFTINISRSGVLFRPEGVVEPKMPIDMILVLPGGVAGEPPSRLRCQGEVVRTTPAAEADVAPTVAAAVGDYRLTAT